MSKTAKTLFICPLCKDRSHVQFKKPSLLSKVVVSYDCPMCECIFEVVLTKTRSSMQKGKPNGNLIDVQIKITHVSDHALDQYDDGTLRRMLAEGGDIYAERSDVSTDKILKEKGIELERGQSPQTL